MFKSLRIRNFRSIVDSKKLALSKLNIIIGPNNSGKSSLIYPLLLIKQTLEDKDLDTVLVTSGPLVELGSFLDIIGGHDRKGKLDLEFALDEDALKLAGFRDFLKPIIPSGSPFTQYKHTLSFDDANDSIQTEAFEVRDTISREVFRGIKLGSKWELHGIATELIPYAIPSFVHFLPHVRLARRINNVNITRKLNQLMFRFLLRSQFLTQLVDRIKYVGPIHQTIPRYGGVGIVPHTDLGPSGQNLFRVLSFSGEVRTPRGSMIKELNYWLDKRFKVLKNVKLSYVDRYKTVKSIFADDPRGQKNINLTSMGSGVSHIVPIIAQTVLTPPGGCIIVEQPEIHLHPSAQADLADLFIEYAKNNRQVIIETHSEHLLLRIRRRVAEGKINPDIIKVIVVDKWGTRTRVRTCELGANGHFVNWPKGFFEEGYREALAIAEAQ